MAAGSRESGESKAPSREGRQEGGSGSAGEESESQRPGVPKLARQEAEAQAETGPGWKLGVDERMLAALDNGVQGGKWFSLIDKVYRPANAAGGMGGSRPTPRRRESMGKASRRLRRGQELPRGTGGSNQGGSLRAEPVRRVDIPKGPQGAAAGHSGG